MDSEEFLGAFGGFLESVKSIGFVYSVAILSANLFTTIIPSIMVTVAAIIGIVVFGLDIINFIIALFTAEEKTFFTFISVIIEIGAIVGGVLLYINKSLVLTLINVSPESISTLAWAGTCVVACIFALQVVSFIPDTIATFVEEGDC